ncbi:MAG TPA: 4-alpha-glucanotransferase [Anaeromyxobacteraceae bacterium]|nr:4-alpha-glucanotransferase [Anaeromyxobacteraceae bacterium]
MARDRRSGILLHPTSLPGPHGVGDLGPAAHRFVGWLAAAGQRLWQVLPLGPTGFGDSPYQALGSLAGNPLLVSLEVLRDEGWLAEGDLAGAPAGDPAQASYERAGPWKRARLLRAAERFRSQASPSARADLEAFRGREAGWLDDFALFAALKEAHGGAPWTRWPEPLARRHPRALAEARALHAAAVEGEVFAQWCFFRQWEALRARCREAGVALLGDLPIYVAHDSVEVWTRPDRFRLGARGEPAFSAGVPPDYFSATGQLWGNPLYDWEALAREEHRFWIERVRGTLDLVDRVRLDHFRGFEAFWEVPGGATDARAGRWVEGPGASLFEALVGALGPLPFVAENLGVITPEVEALRHRFGFPGMAVLQFAFGNDPQAPSFQPHNYERDTVAYTGTHDNDTVVGWWEGGTGTSVRTEEDVAREKARARAYLATDGREMHWVMIRAVLASVADTAVVPLQDVLGLGSEARLNRPSTLGGNWRWRVREEALGPGPAERLRALSALYGRA